MNMPRPLSSTLRRTLAFGVAFGALAADPALALDAAQRSLYAARLADNAAGRHVPTAAPLLPAVASDPLAEAVVAWDQLRRDTYPASFFELASFLRQHPGWPAESTLRSRAERALTASTPMSERLAYFAQFPPQTGGAKFRYAEALVATGRGAEAQALVREAWTQSLLTPTIEAELMGRFSSWLTPTDHVARADRLLWAGSTSAALRLLTLLPADRQAWAQARIALRSNAPDASVRLSAVPPQLQSEAGLIADRVQWLRASDTLGARRLMANSVIAPGSVGDTIAWMKLRLDLARGASRDQHHELAYALASGHNSFAPGLTLSARPLAERQAYTDLEWLAGWTALKQLNRPDQALRHFQNFGTAVLTPVSQARADYWAGRAAEAAGRSEDAYRHYQRAGTHPDQFYGQLALERVGQMVQIPPEQPFPILFDARARFEASELVRATRLLGELGDRTRQGIFMRALVERADTTEAKKLVAELAPQIGRPELAVLAGTSARSDGTMALFSSAFPKLPLANEQQTDWTMIHAITRQESRFDRAAISSAGARGLMQLMPGTAREQADKLGQSYDFTRLTEDEQYNVLLGSAYYQRLLDAWGGNHVLAVASYNAGPGNVRKWIAANGDPRDPAIDVVDWIEAIPIYETRNYVQRVLENAVVYDLMHPSRARMPAQNRLSAYLGKRRPG